MTPLARALCALVLLGCGARSSGARDGGVAAETSDEVPVTGTRSFDVVATLTAETPASSKGVPATIKLTLVLDSDAHRIIAGGGGLAAVVEATTADGHTFHTSQPFEVGSIATCGGGTSVRFDTTDLTITGASLHGHARGAAEISCGDCQFAEGLSAELVGVPDVTPPLVLAISSPSSPFGPFTVFASEPLPASAKARLVASDGTAIDLVPTIPTADVPVIVSFTKPDVVLAPGQGYLVAFAGLVDFAALAGAADGSLRVAAFPAAPLLPEDGFESATAATVGGAAVISAGPLSPLTGGHSLYIGGPTAPRPGGITLGTSFNARLAVQPGDTTLRLSFAVVGAAIDQGFIGLASVGSVGHSAGMQAPVPLPVAPWSTITLDGVPAAVSATQTMELALPADVTEEVVVVIQQSDISCGPTRTSAGLLIDDLRVE